MTDVHVCTAKNNFTVGKLRKLCRHLQRTKPNYIAFDSLDKVFRPANNSRVNTISIDMEPSAMFVYLDNEDTLQDAIDEGNVYQEISTSEFGRIVDAIVGDVPHVR